MSVLILVLFIAVAAIWLRGRHPRRRTANAWLQQGWRHLKLVSGSYSLSDVVDRMVRQALESAVPSISCTYMPGYLRFGISQVDADHWGDLLFAITEELTELITAGAATAGMTIKHSITVRIEVDPSAAAGRPTLTAGMRAPTVAPRAPRPGAKRLREPEHAAHDLVAALTEDETAAMPRRFRGSILPDEK